MVFFVLFVGSVFEIWMAHAIADSALTSTKRYRMAIGRIKL